MKMVTRNSKKTAQHGIRDKLTLRLRKQLRGWEFLGYNRISGFRYLSESNNKKKRLLRWNFECEFSPFRIHTFLHVKRWRGGVGRLGSWEGVGGEHRRLRLRNFLPQIVLIGPLFWRGVFRAPGQLKVHIFFGKWHLYRRESAGGK